MNNSHSEWCTGFQEPSTIGPISLVQFYPASGDFIIYLAAACWLLCDYLDTIGDEATYVWKQSFCVGSFLFFALRYIGIAFVCAGLAISTWPRLVHFDGGCTDTVGAGYDPPGFLTHGWDIVDFNLWNEEVSGITHWIAPALQFTVFWLVEVVMQMRIFALYNNRLLAVINGILFSAEIAAMIYLWLKSPLLIGYTNRAWDGQWGMELDISPVASLLDIFPDPWPIYWIPAIVFEMWLAGLALARLHRKTLKSELVNVLLKDSLMYFIMIVVFMIAHLVLGVRYGLGDRAVPLMIAGETGAGSRLILHLRKAYFKRRATRAAVVASDLPPNMQIQVSQTTSRRVIDESFYDPEPTDQAGLDYIALVRRVPGGQAA